MMKPLGPGSLLLLTSALVAPSAFAQATPNAATAAPDAQPAQDTPPADPAQQQEQETPDVSLPGADAEIVVVGSRQANITRTTPQVISILSSADIARTGEGDIAGALGRVTGLSVVGSGFVYVRGLGDRYSSALLNGSPLPSPEPLKRVVPLDLFPTSVIASSLVQKSYSANFPGEFGGGVINLTTKAVPPRRSSRSADRSAATRSPPRSTATPITAAAATGPGSTTARATPPRRSRPSSTAATRSATSASTSRRSPSSSSTAATRSFSATPGSRPTGRRT
ncbi:MAG: TonB-dependent receptor plug domain-containing protein [Sphingomonas sp.]